MSLNKRTRGKTQFSTPFFFADTSSTTGGGLSGVTSASGGLVMEYRRQGQSTWTSVTPQAGKTLGSYLSGGIVADGSLAGAYEVDFPDAAFASAAGVEWVALRIRGVTNMLATISVIELDAVDYQDAAAFGLSRIDQTIGSRASQTSVDALAGYVDTEVAAIKAKTDNLPSDPADASDIATSFGTVNSTLSTIASYVDTEVAAIKAKTDLITAFPANFSNLGISPTGVIVTVGLVEELGANALTANGAVDAIPIAVWNASTTTTYVDGSFGDRVLISANNNRTVAVTGSGHVAAVLHDAEPNSIPEDAFVSGALSARVLAADAATEIATAVGALQVLTRLDSMIESDGAGQFRFDTIALEMAPAGGGGGGTDWTANERTAIRAILGVPTSGTTPTDPTTGILDEIRDKTALITSGSVQTSIPVTAQGQINGPLYIGDDYLTANGRSFDWIIPLPSGFVAGTSTCKFGMIFEDESGVSQFNLSGTVTDVGGGNVRLRFELPRATTGTLKAGFHRWSTEIVSAAGVEVTAVAYSDRKLVEWREKQT